MTTLPPTSIYEIRNDRTGHMLSHYYAHDGVTAFLSESNAADYTVYPRDGSGKIGGSQWLADRDTQVEDVQPETQATSTFTPSQRALLAKLARGAKLYRNRAFAYRLIWRGAGAERVSKKAVEELYAAGLLEITGPYNVGEDHYTLTVAGRAYATEMN